MCSSEARKSITLDAIYSRELSAFNLPGEGFKGGRTDGRTDARTDCQKITSARDKRGWALTLHIWTVARANPILDYQLISYSKSKYSGEGAPALFDLMLLEDSQVPEH